MTTRVAETKVRKVGNSVGMVLSKEVLGMLQADEGDKLYITKTPDGIMVTVYDPDFAEDMEIANNLMKKRRNLYRKLAE